MLTSVYDQNHNGIVDNAEKVNNHTVEADVPQDAVFTDTTYTAGTGINITNGVISNTQTSAEWGNITGTLSNQTDLVNVLSEKQETIYQQDTAPSNPSEDDLWIDTDDNSNLTHIDSVVSKTSTNAIENQAITNYVDEKNTYSTNEIQIGTWVNGKPLYRKVYKVENKENSYGIANPSNIDTFVKLSVMQKDSSNAWIPAYYWTSSDYLRIFVSNNYIQIRTSKANNAFIHYIIIEYTKTTD